MANNSTNTHGILCFARGVRAVPNRGDGAVNVEPLLPEVHFNIWEQESGSGSKTSSSLLDIGLMIDIDERAESIEFIFPENIAVSSLIDLSSLVAKVEAIPAIFNESWALSGAGAGSVVYDLNGRSASFAIVGVDGLVTEVQRSTYTALSVSVSEWIRRAELAAAATGHPIRRAYIRFRLLEFKKQFYCVGANKRSDDWWQPSWQSTEDIDFRLNVRRGAPADLEGYVGRFVEFSKVHLFLMRSREKDIVFQDKLFKASRSLEDEGFWANYSVHGTKITVENSLLHVKNSLGYQWKAGGDGDAVKEFGTLARFKIVEFGVWKFVLVALLVGALGNMLWDGAKQAYSLLFSVECGQESLPVVPAGEPVGHSKAADGSNQEGQSVGKAPLIKDRK